MIDRLRPDLLIDDAGITVGRCQTQMPPGIYHGRSLMTLELAPSCPTNNNGLWK